MATNPEEPWNIVADMTRGFDLIPVLTRLEFVGAVLCKRAGSPEDKNYDPTLAVLSEILSESHRLLEKVPANKNLIWTDPDPM